MTRYSGTEPVSRQTRGEKYVAPELTASAQARVDKREVLHLPAKKSAAYKKRKANGKAKGARND
jgi:hypothetical protein